jgi:hypothetical protein
MSRSMLDRVQLRHTCPTLCLIRSATSASGLWLSLPSFLCMEALGTQVETGIVPALGRIRRNVRAM